VIVSGASRVTDAMLRAASEAVAGQVVASQPGAALLPAVENLRATKRPADLVVGIVPEAHHQARRRLLA
jgi:malate dehydrogenase (oxaloacetate-decarboxylating)